MKTLNQIYKLVTETDEVDQEAIEFGRKRKKWAKNVATRQKNKNDKDDLFTMEYNNILLRIIAHLTEKGMSDFKAKQFIREILNTGGHRLLAAIYTYIDYSPKINITDYASKSLTIDDLLNILTAGVRNAKIEFEKAFLDQSGTEEMPNIDATAPITKHELTQLLDIDRGKSIITVLFNDVTHRAEHSNDLTVQGNKTLVIKNKLSPLRINDEQNGPAVSIALIEGFKALDAKYNLNMDLSISRKLDDYTIRKNWYLNTLAAQFIERKVPRAEVIKMIVEAFKKLHNTGINTVTLESIMNTFIAVRPGHKFNYDDFIDRYFTFSLIEYYKANKIDYILFYNHEIEKLYIMDCSKFQDDVINMYYKLRIRVPMFNEKTLPTSWTFNIELK